MTAATPGQAFRDTLRERWVARGRCVDMRPYGDLPQEDRDDLEAAAWSAVGVALPGVDAALSVATDDREQVRLARQDRDQLRTAVLSLAADLEESAARTAPSKKTDIENAAAARLRKTAGPPS